MRVSQKPSLRAFPSFCRYDVLGILHLYSQLRAFCCDRVLADFFRFSMALNFPPAQYALAHLLSMVTNPKIIRESRFFCHLLHDTALAFAFLDKNEPAPVVGATVRGGSGWYFYRRK